MTEPEETTDLTAAEPEPPARPPFRARLKHAYLHTLPRLLWELRWLIAVVVAVEVAGFVMGYRAVGRATFEQVLANPEGTVRFTQLKHLVFAVQPGRHDALHYFRHNSVVALKTWAWSVPTLGGYALWATWANGWHFGWVLGQAVPTAHAASGVGPAGTALTLLPHGLFEFPALWLAWAVGLRTGLSWLWRAPGCRRWASLKRWLGNSGLVFMLIIPMLLVAGFLEAYPARRICERYLGGVGVSRQLRQEEVILGDVTGRSYIGNPTLSPAGDRAAEQEFYNLYITNVSTRRKCVFPSHRQDLIGAPAWSPDGTRLAVALSGRHGPNGVFIFDVTKEKGTVLTTDECRVCQDPTWSPKGDRIAVTAAVGPRETKPWHREAWIVDVAHNRWRQVTHLPSGTRVAWRGLSWSPDGRELAFARYGGHGETALWITRVDGSGLRQLTKGKHDRIPAWSPDGRWIAFMSTPPSEEDYNLFDRPISQQKVTFSELHLTRPDGTGLTKSLVKVDDYTTLSWSADSRSLYYTRLNLLLKGTPKAEKAR